MKKYLCRIIWLCLFKSDIFKRGWIFLPLLGFCEYIALIKLRPELEMVVKILNHMPHAIAGYLQKEAELQSITFGKSMIAILPTLVIAAVMLIISGIIFTGGNLNE